MRSVRFLVLLLIPATVAVIGGAPSLAAAQNGVQEAWVVHHAAPDSGNDARDLAVDAAGNACVTGRTYRYSTTGFDYATVRYDPGGAEQWVAHYDGLSCGGDEGEVIATDAEGNVYVAGDAQEVGISYTVIKYDPDGVQEWTAVYGYDTSPGLENYPVGIALDDSGNVIVTGTGLDLNVESHYATVKISPTGALLWATRLGEGNGAHEEAAALAVDDSGYVYVTGRSGPDEFSPDYLTVKYAPDGSELWTARYDGPGGVGDAAYDLAVDANGNVYVTGCSDEDPAGGGNLDFDILTVKYGSDGSELWVARYDAPQPGHGIGRALELDGDGNVYVAGQAGACYTTIKYDTEGVQEWVMQYEGEPGEYGSAEGADLALDGAGNAYVTGWCQRSNGVVRQVASTVKYSPDGFLQWDIEYGGPLEDWSYTVEAIAVDDSENVILAGTSYPPEANAFMYTTVKYAQLPTSAGEAALYPNRLALYPCHPNPSSGTVALSYELPQACSACLELFNPVGNRIRTLANGAHAAGRHEIALHIESLPPGVYFYRLNTEGSAIARRLVLVD